MNVDYRHRHLDKNQANQQRLNSKAEYHDITVPR